jgi:hypothetical protein
MARHLAKIFFLKKLLCQVPGGWALGKEFLNLFFFAFSKKNLC